MLNLSSISHKLQVVLAAAKTTNGCPIVVSFTSRKGGNRGNPASLSVPQLSATNGVTAVDILSTPATADDSLCVESISVYNADTVPTTVAINFVSSGTSYTMTQVLLQVGESLCYENGTGWYVSKTPIPSGRIVTLQAAGTLFNAYTTAKTILPGAAVPTLAANFFSVGRVLTIEGVAGLSNIVTTPGTLTLQVMIGSVIAFTSGAIQMSTTAHTLLPLWFRIMLTCRSVGNGTGATLIGQARVEGQGVVETSGADNVSTVGVVLAPQTAPAVGTGFDSTVANTLDLWAGFSINNSGNGIQIQQYRVNVE